MASGSEAVRTVAHLVLLDSNFLSLPKVVNEGRRVINNIERSASLFLSKTILMVLINLTAVALFFIKPSLEFTSPFRQPSQLNLLSYQARFIHIYYRYQVTFILNFIITCGDIINP